MHQFPVILNRVMSSFPNTYENTRDKVLYSNFVPDIQRLWFTSVSIIFGNSFIGDFLALFDTNFNVGSFQVLR